MGLCLPRVVGTTFLPTVSMVLELLALPEDVVQQLVASLGDRCTAGRLAQTSQEMKQLTKVK